MHQKKKKFCDNFGSKGFESNLVYEKSKRFVFSNTAV
jgi:hypothetical protein